MPLYMIQLSYTPEACASMLKNPTNRFEATRPVLERLGGKWLHGYFAFGEYDVVAIAELPNEVSAIAAAMAFESGGAIKSYKTTPLLTIEQALESMRKATDAATVYTPPGRTPTPARG